VACHRRYFRGLAEKLTADLGYEPRVRRRGRFRYAREHEADEVTRNVLTALRRSFITPLDRGDIKDLITSRWTMPSMR
jgi:hypothetical protein